MLMTHPSDSPRTVAFSADVMFCQLQPASRHPICTRLLAVLMLAACDEAARKPCSLARTGSHMPVLPGSSTFWTACSHHIAHG